jgi:hypothetical protein
MAHGIEVLAFFYPLYILSEYTNYNLNHLLIEVYYFTTFVYALIHIHLQTCLFTRSHIFLHTLHFFICQGWWEEVKVNETTFGNL